MLVLTIVPFLQRLNSTKEGTPYEPFAEPHPVTNDSRTKRKFSPIRVKVGSIFCDFFFSRTPGLLDRIAVS